MKYAVKEASVGLNVMTVEISRGTTHDGPGLRTTVFVKGCPLSCHWCQNPESVSLAQEVWYEAAKCAGCLECVAACPRSALEAGTQGIVIHRDGCAGCGTCAAACPSKALAVTGTSHSVNELVREVMRDKHFYDEFGGGVTISGGEPLLYADFVMEFARQLRENGVHVALDTCGYASRGSVEKVLPFLDAILYDIKVYDPVKHRELTGRGNSLILGNLLATASYIRGELRERRRKILLWIRSPLVPGDTSTVENISQIAGFIAENLIDVVDRWELCTFNPACVTKYIKMQKPWQYSGAGIMAQAGVDRLRAAAVARGIPGDMLAVTGLVK